VGTVRDTIEIARHQVRACAVITDAFWVQSALVAQSAGMPDVPRVRVPYPLAGTGHTNISHAARGAASEVAQALGWT
jgi:hypothetical protein